jgi:uncharacterized membrane protein
MSALAAFNALLALRYLSMNPDVFPPLLRDEFMDRKVYLALHAGGGAVALVIGPWQFWGRLRRNHTKLHRAMGATYLVATVIFGGGAGFLLAFESHGGLTTHVGFGMLAVLWWITGVSAFLSVRAGDYRSHGEWMVRSFSLTFGAVTLRLWLPLFAALGIPFDEAYQTVAWLAWVPNLLVAELYLRVRGVRSLQGATLPNLSRAA